MRIGKKKLKTGKGKMLNFKSEAGRERYEKVAQAFKHGWEGPPGKGKKRKGKKPPE